ncbi:MAG: Rab family GTPase [Candidatus Odinarchaeota archaeon]
MGIFNQRLYKICIVGDGAVGKTTILHQYVDGKFMEDTHMTIGTNFFIKSILINEFNVKAKLQIWDLSGQYHFAAIRPVFYQGATGIIYTFDLTKISTLNNLINWKMEIEKVLDNKIPSILIGNKLDLININEKLPDSKEIQTLRDKLGFSEYFETSAKDNVGIDEAFRRLTLEIYNFFQK